MAKNHPKKKSKEVTLKDIKKWIVIIAFIVGFLGMSYILLYG